LSLKNWIKFIILAGAWGSSFLWIKIAGQEIGPFSLVLLRASFALAGLTVALFIIRPELPRSLRGWLAFAFLGVFNVAVPFVLISWAERTITSGLASILNATVPLFTILLAAAFLPEDGLTAPKLLGLLVGFAGVIVLVYDQVGVDSLNLLSIGAMLLAAAFYGGSAVFARKATLGMRPAAQAFGQSLFSWLVMLPAASLAEGTLLHLPRLPITWLALAWLGLIGTFMATLLFFSLLNTIGPTRSTLVTYTFPLVGMLLGILFLAEPVKWQLFLGAALIISGVWMVNNPPQFLLRWIHRLIPEKAA
jgi:drug/metabolite transporter (DMT)-like permease